MRYELTPMDRSHMKEVVALERQCFTPPWSEQVWETTLFNDMVSVVVAVDEAGHVAGFGVLSAVMGEGCLEKLAVDPKLRRQGVGEEILSVFLRFAKVNLDFVTLEVRQSNAPAIALYEKLGFQEVGRRKNYYAETHEDAILMTVTYGEKS